MRASKQLGCEPFYQLMAAAIGSWFRKRTIRDVNVELALDKNQQYEPLQLNVNEIVDSRKKFAHFIQKIEFPQMIHHQQYIQK